MLYPSWSAELGSIFGLAGSRPMSPAHIRIKPRRHWEVAHLLARHSEHGMWFTSGRASRCLERWSLHRSKKGKKKVNLRPKFNCQFFFVLFWDGEKPWNALDLRSNAALRIAKRRSLEHKNLCGTLFGVYWWHFEHHHSLMVTYGDGDMMSNHSFLLAKSAFFWWNCPAFRSQQINSPFSVAFFLDENTWKHHIFL